MAYRVLRFKGLVGFLLILGDAHGASPPGTERVTVRQARSYD